METHRNAYSLGHALEPAKIQKFGNLTVSPISEDHQSSAKPVAEPGDMKVQMAVTESKLEDWVNDVKEWAE
ncbi:hypothetical protein F7725_028757, partial [Dissostichus mawsoni]